MTLNNYARPGSLRQKRPQAFIDYIPPRFTEAERRAYARERVPREALAARLGVTITTISNWRKKYNCPFANEAGRAEAARIAGKQRRSRRSVVNGFPVTANLTPNEVRLLDYVRKMGTVTSRGLCVVFNWDNRTARAYICRLRKRGVLEKVGPARTNCTYRVPQKYATTS